MTGRTYCMTGADGQVHRSTHRDGLHGGGRVCHPVVVLDLHGYDWLPNRLRIDADRINGETGRKMRELADRIEAQTRPPKPPEPQGLGAVVEDAKGKLWVHRGAGRWVQADEFGLYNWAQIDAVKILSAGWSE